MAYVEAVSTGAGETLLYNIEQAVGATGANAPGDVRLVQCLLRAHYGVRAASLGVDGWGGPTTNAWIKHFQEDMAAQGNNILVDGRLDRALGTTSSVSRTVYGIILLNLSVARNNPAAFRAVPQEVELNASPRANPYNAAPEGAGREVSMVRRNGSLVEVLYEDGSTQQYVVKDTFVITSGGHSTTIYDGTYVRLPDGRMRSIDEPSVPFWE